MKLRDISNAREVLIKLLTNPINAKLAYRINKISNKLMSELKTIENDRIKLVNEFAVQEEDTVVDGKEIKGERRIPEEKISEFMIKFNNYLDGDSQVEIEKIPFEILDELKVTPAEMSVLESFIEEPIEEPNVTRIPLDKTEKV